MESHTLQTSLEPQNGMFTRTINPSFTTCLTSDDMLVPTAAFSCCIRRTQDKPHLLSVDTQLRFVQSEHAESSLSRGRCLQCRSQINIRRFEFRGFPFDFMHLLAIITGTDEFRGVAPGYPPKRRPWSLLIVWENWEGSKATCSPGLFFLQYYYFRWQTE